MREPWFWRNSSLTARVVTGLLMPASAMYQLGQSLRRTLAKPYTCTVPVICIGNATLGGTGKTPFAMLVAKLLHDADVQCFFLTRGYGGALSGPVLVDRDKHNAEDVGDEALLLARHAPTIVAKDRPEGARLAATKGAQVIIMDDGFQNPTLAKDLSILLIATGDAAHRECVFPAGPYRESIDSAKAHANIVVTIGADKTATASEAFHAWLAPRGDVEKQRVIAFAGLGRPEKFFSMLKTCGMDVVGEFAFPDHHPYTTSEIETLARAAKRKNAKLLTTEKDFVRIPSAFHDDVSVFPVAMQINDPAALKQQLLSCIAAHAELSDNG